MIRMVNKDRVKRKLPELLVDGPLTNRNYLYKYQATRKKLSRIEKKSPVLFENYFQKIVRAFKEFEKAMEQEI